MDLSIFSNFLNFNTAVSVLCALFIFNFSSLFILAQENHQKFHSLKLLNMVISTKVIFFTIFIPVLFIILAVIDIIPNKFSTFFSVCSILYGILSSCYLLNRLKCLLDPIYIAKRLIASNATNEFYIYKTSQIDFGESVFDDLLELICGTIARNADIESRKLFDYIFRWLSIHIDKIKPTSKIYWERRNNRFNIFFNTIVEKLINQNNPIIKIHYIESISSIFLSYYDNSDFSKIEFPLNSLTKLANRAIESGSNQDNQIASSIFYTIINPMENILSMIEESENKTTYIIQESNQLRDFYEIILNKLLELYESANKIHNSSFIRQTTLVRRLFNSYSGNDFIIWNRNYLNCYQKISSIYKKIIEANEYDKKSVEFVLSELKTFAYNISVQDTKRTVIKHLFNTFLHDIFHIYYTLIEKTDLLKSFDFEIFYERTWDTSKCDDYQIACYLDAFFQLIQKFFSKNSKKEHFDTYIFNDLWMRIEQIEDIWKEDKIDKPYCKKWLVNVEVLKKEYSNLYNSYLTYMESYKEEIEKLKKTMKEEVYVE